jgi:inner membrane protein
LLGWLEPRWVLGGVLDEPAHLATGLILLANLPPAGRVWTAGYVIGCVAVDVDHVPLLPVRHRTRTEAPRPAAHSLLVPAGLGAVAGFSRGRARETLFGAAAGTCAHFMRDLATGSGLAPLQPLVRWRTKLPRSLYALVMALLAIRAARLSR